MGLLGGVPCFAGPDDRPILHIAAGKGVQRGALGCIAGWPLLCAGPATDFFEQSSLSRRRRLEGNERTAFSATRL